MELLPQKARLGFGDQDWSAWTWEAREYATAVGAPRTIRFGWHDGAWTRKYEGRPPARVAARHGRSLILSVGNER
jgi:hypothetical protein